MGVNDALNPNNEFVEITVDPRFASAPVALRGFLLQNKLGETFAFPDLTLEPGASLRVYTGQGSPARGAAWRILAPPGWDGWGECAQLVHPSGGRYRVGYRSGCAVTQGFKVLVEEKEDALLAAHRLPPPVATP